MQANSYTTPGTTGGNREDLRDILTILEPEETPFTSMVKKGPSPKSTYVEVLADTLRKPRTTGTPEGRDAGRGGNKTEKRARFGSNVHRVMDEWSVSDVQQRISEVGGSAANGDEEADSKAKTVREVKRDIEAVCCGNQEMQAGTDEADMQTRGVFKWLSTSAQSVHPVPSDFRPASAQVASGKTAVTEAELNDVLIGIKRAYGVKKTLQGLAGDTVIKVVDNFTRVQPTSTNQRYNVVEDASKHEITMMVKVFESSHARLELIPTQFNQINSSGDDDVYTMYILNMQLWELQFLDSLHAGELADEGGGPRGFVKAMFACLCRHPKGNGMVYNT